MARYRDLDKIDPFRCGFHVSVMRAKFLEWLPEEDVAPVVHAHWIKRKAQHYNSKAEPTWTANTYQCGNCEMITFNNFPYCPHCGAKMDEEAE